MNLTTKNIIFLFLLWWLIVLLMGCQNPQDKPGVFQARKGILTIHSKNISAIPLDGQWEFYWSKLIRPADFQVKKVLVPDVLAQIPQVWNAISIQNQTLPGTGFATYRLRVILSKTFENLAIQIPTFSTAAVIYVNGKLLYEVGKVGTQVESSVPAYKPSVVVIPGQNNRLDIIIQVSNFHYVKGGIWQSIYLGDEEYLFQQRKLRVVQEIFLAACILMMFIYNAALFFTFRKEPASLYFAAVCFFVSLRTISIDEYLIQEVLPINWFWVIRMEYLSYFLTVWVFAEFAFTTFEKSFSPIVIRLSRVYSGILVGFVLVTPTVYFTSLILYYHAFTLLLSLYFFFVLIREMIQRFKTAIFYFIGWVFLFVTLLNDMLYNFHLINTGNYGPAGIFIFMLFYTYVITGRIASIYKNVDNLNLALQRQNAELEQMIYDQTQDLEEANQELIKTNQDLRYKIKKVEASINYAQRIQDAILPSFSDIKTHIPDSFIFYRPRDVVSGDFYWFGEQNGLIFVAAMDCTGHGVPGAFMSMMGNDLLNEIIHYQKVTDVSRILKLMNDRVSENLRTTDSFVHDGMDIALVAIHPTKRILEYAGAHMPLFLVQKNKIKEIPGERVSIGNLESLYGTKKNNFSKHTIYLNTSTVIYMFSDGFQDQFGGPKNRKYMAKRFKKLLYLQHRLAMEDQKKMLEDSFQNWLNPQPSPKTPYEQIDDVMVIGLKLDFNT